MREKAGGRREAEGGRKKAEDAPFKSGFVSILGRPNVGKSTLLNALAGAQLAIISDKPQTTRTLVQGVWNAPNAQVVFLDTPGIHQAGSLLNRRMMESVNEALRDRDLLIYIVDAMAPPGEAERDAIETIRQARAPVVLVMNKIDRVTEKRRLLPLIEQYKALYDFADYVPISALSGDGLDELRAVILHRLPEGPAWFPAEYLTDQPERFLVAELIREKALHATHQEVPHAVAVLVDEWEEKPAFTRIAATIYVEREGQKGILIGAGASMLKRIGTLARAQIERLLDRHVFLELYVKTRPNWRDDPQFLDELDWRSMVGHDAEVE